MISKPNEEAPQLKNGHATSSLYRTTIIHGLANIYPHRSRTLCAALYLIHQYTQSDGHTINLFISSLPFWSFLLAPNTLQSLVLFSLQSRSVHLKDSYVMFLSSICPYSPALVLMVYVSLSEHCTTQTKPLILIMCLTWR
jgi:hypothetical protein